MENNKKVHNYVAEQLAYLNQNLVRIYQSTKDLIESDEKFKKQYFEFVEGYLSSMKAAFEELSAFNTEYLQGLKKVYSNYDNYVEALLSYAKIMGYHNLKLSENARNRNKYVYLFLHDTVNRGINKIDSFASIGNK